jgi:hypothetical protein
MVLLGTPKFYHPYHASALERVVVPVQIMADWMTMCSDLTATDNGGSAVINAGAITRDTLIDLPINGLGTSLLVRMRYVVADPPTTDPLVQCFGFDADDKPVKLLTAASVHELLLVVDADDEQYTDAAGVTWGMTELFARGSTRVRLAVQTASAGSSAGAELAEAKLI